MKSHSAKRFFYNDPNGGDFSFFDTLQEARIAAERSVYGVIMDEGPESGDEGICYGVILGKADSFPHEFDPNCQVFKLFHYSSPVNGLDCDDMVLVPRAKLEKLVKRFIQLSGEMGWVRGIVNLDDRRAK